MWDPGVNHLHLFIRNHEWANQKHSVQRSNSKRKKKKRTPMQNNDQQCVSQPESLTQFSQWDSCQKVAVNKTMRLKSLQLGSWKNVLTFCISASRSYRLTATVSSFSSMFKPNVALRFCSELLFVLAQQAFTKQSVHSSRVHNNSDMLFPFVFKIKLLFSGSHRLPVSATIQVTNIVRYSQNKVKYCCDNFENFPL